jgi:hypothetical protein
MNTLITKDQIASIVVARKNYDTNVFKESLIEAIELASIKPLLGSDLYLEIRTQYLANNLSPQNTTLVNSYLRNYLAYEVAYLCAPLMQVDVSSIGMVINNSENSNSISSELRAEVATTYKLISESFKLKTKDFLESNYAAYPLYKKKSSVTIIGGIIFENKEVETSVANNASQSWFTQDLNVQVLSSGQNSAYQINLSYTTITSAVDNYNSVKLPMGAVGHKYFIYNNCDKIISVYPQNGESINGIANYQFNIDAYSVMSFECFYAGKYMAAGLSI